MYLVDLIGFGDSAAPEDWPYTIEAQAEVLVDFIGKKRISEVILVAHSYGGAVSLMLSHKMITRGSGAVIKCLILIAPAAFPQTLPCFISIPRIPILGRAVLSGLSAEFQVSMILRYIIKNKSAVTAARIKRYAANIARPAYRKALVQTAKNIFPSGLDRLLDELHRIYYRTLLIYGENDTVIPKDNLERLSKTLPNVTTGRVPNCGHLPQEEYPRLTAELITGFLQP